jgi:superfamily II DNA or RNA helicase
VANAFLVLVAPPLRYTRRMLADGTPDTLDETFAALCDLAHRKVAPLKPDWAAAQVLTVTAGADYSVRRAALDALVRRLRFAERDGLKVVERPGRSVLGRYVTGRAGGDARPYATELWGIAPLRASCGCADFVRSSLGACKHVLTVLVDVLARGRFAEDVPLRANAIAWSPHLPLDGALDRLSGLRRAASAGRPPTGWKAAPEDPCRLVADYWERVSKGGASRCLTSHPERAPDLAALTEPKARRKFLLGLAGDLRSMDPASRTVVSEELERAERLISAATALPRATAQLATIKRRLYPYQEEGVRRFFAAKRLLLADDMGLGKTTQAIAACHALFRAKAIHRGILVVPAALKSQWAREWADTTDLPLTEVDGTPAERAALYDGLGRGFLVMGYEQLLKDFEQVAALAPDLVVLDEAQRIKNFATKTAVYVKALTPEYRLVLTGTPMENRLDELASLLDWVDDVALAPKWRLSPYYTFHEGDGGAGTSGARHLDTLRGRIDASVVRRRRQEVLSQLPKRTDTRVPVPMTEPQRQAHDDHNRPIAQLLAIGKKRPLRPHEHLKLMSLLTSQRIVSNGLAQRDFDETWPRVSIEVPTTAVLEGLFSPKLGEIRALIEELAIRQGRKVVVFSQWRRMLRLAEWSVRDVLSEAGVRSVFFTGGESQKVRTQSVVELHDDPDTRVMFLSDAGGVGLNLQRAASACINLESPWNPAVLEQRIGRIYRLGQKRPIDVYHLVCDYGIESRISDLVANKRAVFKGLFDGTTDEVRFEGKASLLADVEKLVAVAPEVSAAVEAEDAPAEEIAPLTDTIPTEAPKAGGAEIAQLFSRLSVRRTESGGISIEAPPEAAGALAAVFSGLARMLEEAGK